MGAFPLGPLSDVRGEEVGQPAEEGHISTHGQRLDHTYQGLSHQREPIQ